MTTAKYLPAMLLLVGFVLAACAGEPDPGTMKMTKAGLDKTSPEFSLLDQRGP